MTGGPAPPLTGREREVVELLCEGLTAKEIRHRLDVSPWSAASYADIDPMWAPDPEGVTRKKNIGPLIQAGLALC